MFSQRRPAPPSPLALLPQREGGNRVRRRWLGYCGLGMMIFRHCIVRRSGALGKGQVSWRGSLRDPLSSSPWSARPVRSPSCLVGVILPTHPPVMLWGTPPRPRQRGVAPLRSPVFQASPWFDRLTTNRLGRGVSNAHTVMQRSRRRGIGLRSNDEWGAGRPPL